MELIVAFHAKSPMEAQIVKGRLAAEGLHPVVPGEELNDEFAMAGKMAGTLGVQVLVPESEGHRAKDLVAAFQAQGPIEDPGPGEGEGEA